MDIIEIISLLAGFFWVVQLSAWAFQLVKYQHAKIQRSKQAALLQKRSVKKSDRLVLVYSDLNGVKRIHSKLASIFLRGGFAASK